MVYFIFVTGGVVSSLGKGLTTASLGNLLQARDFSVSIKKLDPYLNVDPGTMNPIQHGEIFVTDDGTETDLDLGHYERFTEITTSKKNNTTAGKIYSSVIQKERQGKYLGKTVQVIPHITDEIKDFILQDSEQYDFVICEIGGTVGDMESQPFLEAIRQIGYNQKYNSVLYIHMTLIPIISATGELKTKPTQHSVKELRSIGIQPDLLLCRSHKEIPDTEKKKIALFCNTHEDCVFTAIDTNNVYDIPVRYNDAGLDLQLLKHFGIQKKSANLSKWKNMLQKMHNASKEVKIALVGKYVSMNDSYKSITEALVHGGIQNGTKIKIICIDALEITKDNVCIILSDIDAIVVPGGFGIDGFYGKILATKFARENNVPYFGICLGLQVAVVEAAKNVCGILDANSVECEPECENKVITLIKSLKSSDKIKDEEELYLGGTMRLGSFECIIKENSLAHKIYKKFSVNERHRHRYEMNADYVSELEKYGLLFSGYSKSGLPEIMENTNHAWFMCVQFHPEYKSYPCNPHPIFFSFIEAALKFKQNRKN